jgi:hypothetical protein
MREMKFEAPEEEIDALFTEWDPDGSGALELKELEKRLRRGGAVKLDDKLQAGAMGDIGTKSENKHALRKGKLQRQGSLLLQGMDIDEDSDKTVGEQLREALSKAAVRVIDLFREWDEVVLCTSNPMPHQPAHASVARRQDGNGKVSKAEFHKAMGYLQFNAPAEAIDELFDSWDPDGSGLLTMDELQKELRRGNSIKLDSKLQAGGAGAIELSSENKHTLRGKGGAAGGAGPASASEPLRMPSCLGSAQQPQPLGGGGGVPQTQTFPLPPVKEPLRARRKQPLAPGVVWSEQAQRYMSRGARMLGSEWRQKLHERNLFWDDVTQSYVNRGQWIMMRAPGGPGTKQPSIVEMHRARVGIGTESEARQMGFRLHTPARPSGARLGSAWELPLLHGMYGKIEAPESFGRVSTRVRNASESDLRAADNPRVRARREQQIRFREDVRRVHENSMHASFLGARTV